MRHQTYFLPWFQEQRHHFAGLLFDIDGTLIRGGTALEGAKDMLAYMTARHVPYLLVTNDASNSHLEKCHLLRSSGLIVEPDHIISAGDALRFQVGQGQLRGELFFVMGGLGTPDYAETAGLKVTRNLADLNDCRGVIIGESHFDWESTFNAVINYFLKSPGGLLIVPNADTHFLNRHKDVCIAPAGIARFLKDMLAQCGHRLEPVYLGKPRQAIFEHSLHTMLDRYKLPAGSTRKTFLMVGDSLETDILGANTFGFTSCLVLTGVTSQGMLERIAPTSPRMPTYQFESLAAYSCPTGADSG